MRRWRPTVLACSVALVAILVPGALPAAADVTVFSDRGNDARPTVDIEKVRVDNGKRVVVTTTFDNLRRSLAGGLGVYFDTRRPDRGPEYVAAGGIDAQGTDWQITRIEDWRHGQSQLLYRCDIDMRVSFKKDKATFDIARRCLKRPGRIRVAAHSTGQRVSQRDWAPKRHRFYDWVRR